MPATTGVLVVNLGTPDAPTPEAVRRFLAEFLSDPRVVDLPRLPWQIVLRSFILPFRPARSAHAYQQVWTPAGSPLLTGTEALTRALGRKLAEHQAEPPVVAMGMTYGNPSIAHALDQLRTAGVDAARRAAALSAVLGDDDRRGARPRGRGARALARAARAAR